MSNLQFSRKNSLILLSPEIFLSKTLLYTRVFREPISTRHCTRVHPVARRVSRVPFLASKYLSAGRLRPEREREGTDLLFYHCPECRRRPRISPLPPAPGINPPCSDTTYLCEPACVHFASGDEREQREETTSVPRLIFNSREEDSRDKGEERRKTWGKESHALLRLRVSTPIYD